MEIYFKKYLKYKKKYFNLIGGIPPRFNIFYILHKKNNSVDLGRITKSESCIYSSVDLKIYPDIKLKKLHTKKKDPNSGQYERLGRWTISNTSIEGALKYIVTPLNSTNSKLELEDNYLSNLSNFLVCVAAVLKADPGQDKPITTIGDKQMEENTNVSLINDELIGYNSKKQGNIVSIKVLIRHYEKFKLTYLLINNIFESWVSDYHDYLGTISQTYIIFYLSIKDKTNSSIEEYILLKKNKYGLYELPLYNKESDYLVELKTHLKIDKITKFEYDTMSEKWKLVLLENLELFETMINSEDSKNSGYIFVKLDYLSHFIGIISKTITSTSTSSEPKYKIEDNELKILVNTDNWITISTNALYGIYQFNKYKQSMTTIFNIDFKTETHNKMFILSTQSIDLGKNASSTSGDSIINFNTYPDSQLIEFIIKKKNVDGSYSEEGRWHISKTSLQGAEEYIKNYNLSDLSNFLVCVAAVLREDRQNPNFNLTDTDFKMTENNNVGIEVGNLYGYDNESKINFFSVKDLIRHYEKFKLILLICNNERFNSWMNYYEAYLYKLQKIYNIFFIAREEVVQYGETVEKKKIEYILLKENKYGLYELPLCDILGVDVGLATLKQDLNFTVSPNNFKLIEWSSKDEGNLNFYLLKKIDKFENMLNSKQDGDEKSYKFVRLSYLIDLIHSILSPKTSGENYEIDQYEIKVKVKTDEVINISTNTLYGIQRFNMIKHVSEHQGGNDYKEEAFLLNST